MLYAGMSNGGTYNGNPQVRRYFSMYDAEQVTCRQISVLPKNQYKRQLSLGCSKAIFALLYNDSKCFKSVNKSGVFIFLVTGICVPDFGAIHKKFPMLFSMGDLYLVATIVD